MVDSNAIKEHMEVVSSNGIHLGAVDRVEKNSIKLTRNDPDANGKHHFIPLDWVDSVGVDIRLNKTWEEAKDQWQTSAAAAGG